uniref:TsaA-like domain-containing protein n=1 Tax=Chromera velia CCMP2878 TaxID=1169474 RepID=A0A0G4I915_9ALVE|mmetsp:Transcript_8428/g.16370  ORF Transcript_8428/g.16370 Transcript_8428/m.16370 type:complete len:452 (-) Transcript_8428:4-1359(-)|eukprot:Cvel_12106.t1-p1 / transcript=Cvel_12106.t1 / gene=Cvel_12106 / organism=Chromera_velia_CCMP2878 / gene_product=Probable tRNA (adenine(37)-N6)-methyltransferase, putative / transcript_product=Probable tRNA (adenine(37)-N6)-methyltransferase, putative / location=Cvel_scaffold780:5615-8763(-) / protein_length=451 / sequence_SO=supercontig / SO=protein_coding / is_pseudo=false
MYRFLLMSLRLFAAIGLSRLRSPLLTPCFVSPEGHSCAFGSRTSAKPQTQMRVRSFNPYRTRRPPSTCRWTHPEGKTDLKKQKGEEEGGVQEAYTETPEQREASSSPSSQWEETKTRVKGRTKGKGGNPKRGPLRPRRFYTDDFLSKGDWGDEEGAGICLRPVAVVRSPYKERFGTPRQPPVTEGTLGGCAQNGTIQFLPHVHPELSLQDLEGFEYVWVISVLHLNQGWRPKVKVYPRGLSTRFGVFSTRAPHRPNPIGLSAVRVTEVNPKNGTVGICGHDFLDGTPVLDVKPYVPYCDAFPEARSGWLERYDERAMRGGDAFAFEKLPAWCEKEEGEAGVSADSGPLRELLRVPADNEALHSKVAEGLRKRENFEGGVGENMTRLGNGVKGTDGGQLEASRVESQPTRGKRMRQGDHGVPLSVLERISAMLKNGEVKSARTLIEEALQTE